MNFCVLGSDLMWFQHILMYNSWPSRCLSCDQPILPRWKVWTWRFWKTFGRGGWGVVARRDIFLHAMVGGDGGVVRPKKLVGLVGTVTDSRLTLLQHHASPRSKHSFLPQCRNTRNLKWVCEGRPQLLLCKFQKLRPPTQMKLAVPSNLSL